MMLPPSKPVVARWLLAAALATTTGCPRSPIEPAEDGPTVDAMTYARGLCLLKCYRLIECGETAEAEHGQCEAQCVDEALQALPGDPCWAEWVEVRRCHVRRTSCEGVAEESPPASDICDTPQRRLDACEP